MTHPTALHRLPGKLLAYWLLAVVTASSQLLTAQDFDNVEITTIPIRDNLYMLQGQGGNIAVSVGEDGVLIVDNQFAPLSDKITAAIRALTDRPVTYVVNSHFHYDHTGGNVNFGRAGATLVAHDNSRRRMEATQVLSSGYVQEASPSVGLPRVTFFEDMRFYFNGSPVDFLFTGAGHTDGDAQVYFRAANIIHTGDMFVRYGLPFVDYNNGGTLDGMIESLWNIASIIDEDTVVVPGHGELARRADLLEFRNMLVQVRSNLNRAAVQGLSPQAMLDTEPAAGFAANSDGTREWLLRAYPEYRR